MSSASLEQQLQFFISFLHFSLVSIRPHALLLLFGSTQILDTHLQQLLLMLKIGTAGDI